MKPHIVKRNLEVLEIGVMECAQDYKDIYESTRNFINRYGKYRLCLPSNKDSNVEYNVVYNNLWDFYIKVRNTSRIDLNKVEGNIRKEFEIKKEFCEEVKGSLKGLFYMLDKFEHPCEESPFYLGQERQDL